MKPALFYSILTIVIMGLLNAACKKSDAVSGVTYSTLKVMELGTHLPIVGAEVKIYECTKHSSGGCADLSAPTILITDKDGNFQFDSKLNVYLVLAAHDKYWDGGSGGTDIVGNPQPVTNIYLSPVAYTKIHIKEIDRHPLGLFMVVNVKQDTSFLSYGSRTTFSLPADSTFDAPSYGNTNNFLNWYFIDGRGNIDSTSPGGQLPSYYINRFDTASVEINY
jgi:hypothetical protein